MFSSTCIFFFFGFSCLFPESFKNINNTCVRYWCVLCGVWLLQDVNDKPAPKEGGESASKQVAGVSTSSCAGAEQGVKILTPQQIMEKRALEKKEKERQEKEQERLKKEAEERRKKGLGPTEEEQAAIDKERAEKVARQQVCCSSVHVN